jgi:hypothetical protein
MMTRELGSEYPDWSLDPTINARDERRQNIVIDKMNESLESLMEEIETAPEHIGERIFNRSFPSIEAVFQVIASGVAGALDDQDAEEMGLYRDLIREEAEYWLKEAAAKIHYSYCCTLNESLETMIPRKVPVFELRREIFSYVTQHADPYIYRAL